MILSSDIHRLNSTLLPIALERRFTVYKVKTASVVIDTSGTKSNENNMKKILVILIILIKHSVCAQHVQNVLRTLTLLLPKQSR